MTTSIIKNLLIKVVVLEEALLMLLSILGEKGILTLEEQKEIINAIEFKLSRKNE